MWPSNKDGVNKGQPCIHRAYKQEFIGPLTSQPSERSRFAASAFCPQEKGSFQWSWCETPQTWHRRKRKQRCVSTGFLLTTGRSHGFWQDLYRTAIAIQSGNPPCIMKEQGITFPEHSQGKGSLPEQKTSLHMATAALVKMFPPGTHTTVFLKARFHLAPVDLHDST